VSTTPTSPQPTAPAATTSTSTGPTAAAALSIAEQSSLARCEQIIDRGLSSFVEVGTALAEIRDKRLYRTAEEPNWTFGDYCKERWGIGRDYAYKQIDSAIIHKHLSTIVDISPATESQCRPLTTIRKTTPDGERVLDMERIGEAWGLAVKRASVAPNSPPKITAKVVSEAVQATVNPHRQTPVVDADLLQKDTTERNRLFRECRITLQDFQGCLQALLDSPWGRYLVPSEVRGHVKQLRTQLRNQFPRFVCPDCEGRGCEPCAYTGMTTRQIAEQAREVPNVASEGQE